MKEESCWVRSKLNIDLKIGTTVKFWSATVNLISWAKQQLAYQFWVDIFFVNKKADEVIWVMTLNLPMTKGVAECWAVIELRA